MQYWQNRYTKHTYQQRANYRTTTKYTLLTELLQKNTRTNTGPILEVVQNTQN